MKTLVATLAIFVSVSITTAAFGQTSPQPSADQLAQQQLQQLQSIVQKSEAQSKEQQVLIDRLNAAERAQKEEVARQQAARIEQQNAEREHNELVNRQATMLADQQESQRQHDEAQAANMAMLRSGFSIAAVIASIALAVWIVMLVLRSSQKKSAQKKGMQEAENQRIQKLGNAPAPMAPVAMAAPVVPEAKPSPEKPDEAVLRTVSDSKGPALVQSQPKAKPQSQPKPLSPEPLIREEVLSDDDFSYDEKVQKFLQKRGVKRPSALIFDDVPMDSEIPELRKFMEDHPEISEIFMIISLPQQRLCYPIAVTFPIPDGQPEYQFAKGILDRKYTAWKQKRVYASINPGYAIEPKAAAIATAS